MSLLPFHLRSTPPRIIIVGGGYAGLAALTTLRRHSRSCAITLVDPRSDHLKIVHLHERFRAQPPPLTVAFSRLAQRFAFRHVEAHLPVGEGALLDYHTDRCIDVDGETLPFDYLLLACGADYERGSDAERIVDLADLAASDFETVSERVGSLAGCGLPITVVGAGATGIQFLFEIDDFLKRHRLSNPLRLLDAGDRPLASLPPDLSRYVSARLADRHIEFLPNQRFVEQRPERLVIRDGVTGKHAELPSALSFCFTGKRHPRAIATDPFGQVLIGGRRLTRIFAAGDCSHYRSIGSNALAAQSASSKGRLCARNMLRHWGYCPVLEPYVYREVGYLVSLGSRDAIGWLGLRRNVVAGPPAALLKDLVETRHDLSLAGVDACLTRLM